MSRKTELKKINLRGIKERFLVNIILLILITNVAISFGAYYYGKKALEKNATSFLTQIGNDTSDIIESNFIQGLNELKVLSVNEKLVDESISIEDRVTILKSMSKLLGAKDIAIANIKGDAITTNGIKLNIADTDYFKAGSQGMLYISDPFINKIDNTLQVAYTIPLKAGDKVVAVGVVFKPGDQLSKIVSKTNFGKTGQVYMINKEGTIVAHKDNSLVLNKENIIKKSETDKNLKGLADIEKKIISGKAGIDKYADKGKGKYIAYRPIGEGGDSFIVVTIDEKELLGHLNELTIAMFIITGLSIIIAIICIFILTTKLANRLIRAKDSLEKVADGDFTELIGDKDLKSKDEVGDIFRALTHIQFNIKEVIKSIQDSAKNVEGYSQGLAAISQEFTTTTEDISAAIHKTANGTQDQANDLEFINKILEAFSNKIEVMLQKAFDAESLIESINSRAEESNVEMNLLINSINNFSLSFNEFALKLNGMKGNMSTVNDITNIINEIAEQTNLLALNAAIEAARAGEAGKGFAVVADEIRILAEQSKDASEQIKSVVNGVLTETEDIVNSSDTFQNEFEVSKDNVNKAINSFDDISKLVKRAAPAISEVYTSVNIINKDKDAILEKVNNSSAISQEVSATTEEVAVSSEGFTESSAKIAQSASSLFNITKEMMDKINKFKV